VVHAECNSKATSSNDAETACHDCATDTWSTGSCTWHLAESYDAYCGSCQVGQNCARLGRNRLQSVVTYANGTCTSTGCYGGDPQPEPAAVPDKNGATYCGG
jgi:hypothetical protein